jgi:hypothetical protein
MPKRCRKAVILKNLPTQQWVGRFFYGLPGTTISTDAG